MNNLKRIPLDCKLTAYFFLSWGLWSILLAVFSLYSFNTTNEPLMQANSFSNMLTGLFSAVLFIAVFVQLVKLNNPWRRVAVFLLLLGCISKIVIIIRYAFEVYAITIQLPSPFPAIIPDLYYVLFLFVLNVWMVYVLTRKDVRELFETETEKYYDDHPEYGPVRG